jgi:hypothetical protein
MNKNRIISYVETNPDLLIGKKRQQTYSRYYLYGLLRDIGITYHEIGRLFGRNHSTIIHGTRQHDNFNGMGDQLYLELTDQLRSLFEPEAKSLDLVQDILNCKSMRGLDLIKARVRGGVYLNLTRKS